MNGRCGVRSAEARNTYTKQQKIGVLFHNWAQYYTPVQMFATSRFCFMWCHCQLARVLSDVHSPIRPIVSNVLNEAITIIHVEIFECIFSVWEPLCVRLTNLFYFLFLTNVVLFVHIDWMARCWNGTVTKIIIKNFNGPFKWRKKILLKTIFCAFPSVLGACHRTKSAYWTISLISKQ